MELNKRRLIYINDLLDGLPSSRMLFADDSTLFSTVDDITVVANNLDHIKLKRIVI